MGDGQIDRSDGRLVGKRDCRWSGVCEFGVLSRDRRAKTGETVSLRSLLVAKTVRLSGRESAVLSRLLLVRETGNDNIIHKS